ncbi:MAG: DUF4988 and DUF4465 domain-containing protein [Odoribacteraceae bacterium]|jgi:hypothetical protein|nr:DUF4988 and DUF4465 domain-containing protein [Odoribacteraceae bacterium]
MNKILSILIAALLFAGLSGCYDDSGLKDSIQDIEEKVKMLEQQIHLANDGIADLQLLVSALTTGKRIVNVEEADGAGGSYRITFNDDTFITLRDGTNGAPGADAPVIGVKEDDGIYYWTITTGTTTGWLTDAGGEKLPVSGSNGTTPVIGVDGDGYWTVDGTRLTGADDQFIKASGEAGESVFSGVSQDDNAVTFKLANGTAIVIPKAGNLAIETDAEKLLYVKHGETATYSLTLSGEGSLVITKPDGWKVTLEGSLLSVTAPPLENTFAEKEGTVSITAIGKNATVNRSFAVSARDYTHLIDFEAARVADYLAGPTSYGENLYSSSASQYVGYDDAATGLFMMVNESYGSYDFWSGGIAISRWNDMETAGHLNQCSVYYRDPVTGKGGYRGSSTFAVHYGNNNEQFWDGRTLVSFLDNGKEAIFDHFYVTNSTYTALSMKRGDPFAAAHNYENKHWFKLIIEGIDKDGRSTGTVDFYLSDFRTPASPGIVTGWMPVDLTPLGKVTAIRFDMEGSDDNGYGVSTPVYFCFDNLAVKLLE